MVASTHKFLRIPLCGEQCCDHSKLGYKLQLWSKHMWIELCISLWTVCIKDNKGHNCVLYKHYAQGYPQFCT